MGESTHGGDRLVGQIVFSGCVVLDNLALAGVDTTTDTVNLFVQLGTMMVTLLTSTRNRELDTRRMPSSDTGDLTQTFVGLAGQLACVPTRSDTLESFTLGDTNDNDHLVLGEDRCNGYRLLQVLTGPINLLGNCSTVNLDLHNVRFLLALAKKFHLSVGNNSDSFAIAFHGFKILLDDLLAQIILPFLGGLGESLLLGFVPVLVETTRQSSPICSAQTVLNALSPLGVATYPTIPTITNGGVSKMVTASTTSFLLTFEPGLSTSRTMWVIPAL